MTFAPRAFDGSKSTKPRCAAVRVAETWVGRVGVIFPVLTRSACVEKLDVGTSTSTTRCRPAPA